MIIIIILMVMIIMIMMVIMTMIHYQGLVAHSLVPWLARCWTSHHGQTVTSKSKNSGRMVMMMVMVVMVMMVMVMVMVMVMRITCHRQMFQGLDAEHKDEAVDFPSSGRNTQISEFLFHFVDTTSWK